jgi:serine protease Do
MAKSIMEDLIYEGKVSRGWLGVMIQDLDQATVEAFGLDPNTKGVLIGDVFKGQPADKAGIKRGDVIQTFNGKPVPNPNELRNQVATIHPGQKVPVELIRAGKKTTVYVVLSGRDKESLNKLSSQDQNDDTQNEAQETQSLGIKAGNITDEIRNELDLDQSVQGVVVLDVKQGSQAYDAGIQPNDIIMEINRKAVTNTNTFKQAMKEAKNNDSVLFLIQREGNTFYKAFKIKK